MRACSTRNRILPCFFAEFLLLLGCSHGEYYPTVACLIDKKRRSSLHLPGRSRPQSTGKPRIVEQVKLGPKQRVLQEIKPAYTRGKNLEPIPLKKLRVKEFGTSALLWYWAQQLQLVQIVDRQVPPVGPPPPMYPTLSGTVPDDCRGQSGRRCPQ